MTYEIDPRTGFQVRSSGSEVPPTAAATEAANDLGQGSLRPSAELTIQDARNYARYKKHKQIMNDLLKEANQLNPEGN